MLPTAPSGASVSSPDDDQTADRHSAPLDGTALPDICPPVRRGRVACRDTAIPGNGVAVCQTAVPKWAIRLRWSDGDPVFQCVWVLSEGNEDRCQSSGSPFCVLAAARPANSCQCSSATARALQGSPTDDTLTPRSAIAANCVMKRAKSRWCRDATSSSSSNAWSSVQRRATITTRWAASSRSRKLVPFRGLVFVSPTETTAFLR
jgi:hypothetical protein